MKNNLILVDADGVLFDWEWGFDRYMTSKGYRMQPGGQDEYLIDRRFYCTPSDAQREIKEFNESSAIAFLPPLRDVVEYVRRLHSEGWQFTCITSLSSLDSARDFRRRALDREFGKNTISELVCLPTGSDKHHALEPYRDSGLWWVEDKPENADVGYEMGLRSILMQHGHNTDHKCPYPTVKNWQEIYHIISNDL